MLNDKRININSDTNFEASFYRRHYNRANKSISDHFEKLFFGLAPLAPYIVTVVNFDYKLDILTRK